MLQQVTARPALRAPPPRGDLLRVPIDHLFRDHAVFDADHALLPGPVPRHPGHRASEAHPVQEVSGRRGGAGWSLQLRLPVLLLATRAAEGRRVLAPRHGRDLVLIFSMHANIVTKITANGRFREPQCARMTTPNHNQPDESASAPLFPCLALAPPQPHNWHARDKRSRLQS